MGLMSKSLYAASLALGAIAVLQPLRGAQGQAFPAPPDDPEYGKHWNYTTTRGVNAPRAWASSVTGNGIVVAVISTGYRPHSDLNGQIIDGYDFIHDPEEAFDGDGIDDSALDPGDGGGECDE